MCDQAAVQQVGMMLLCPSSSSRFLQSQYLAQPLFSGEGLGLGSRGCQESIHCSGSSW